VTTPNTLTPAPKVGDQVMPHEGLIWAGKTVPLVPHTVVAVQDERHRLADAHVVVLQMTSLVDWAVKAGHRINTEIGAHVGFDDVTPIADAEWFDLAGCLR
jgi:hypothetical protein